MYEFFEAAFPWILLGLFIYPARRKILQGALLSRCLRRQASFFATRTKVVVREIDILIKSDILSTRKQSQWETGRKENL